MIKNLINNLKQTIFRFPLPSLCSLLFCIITIYAVRADKAMNIYLFTLFGGFLWFISSKILAESMQWKLKYYYPISILGFIGIIALNISIISFVFLASGLFLSIFIVAFLNKKTTCTQLWALNLHLCSHLGFTILVSSLLFLMLSGVIFSLEFLFELNYNKIYLYLLLVIATFLAPLIAMSGIPKNHANITMSKSLQIILSYLVLPLLGVYTIILYGYALKILITWNLPKGGVVYLVSGFSCLGMFAYFISYPLHKAQGIIKLFSKYFFTILLLPLVLLTIAITVRIKEYGITEGRYTVVLCLLWLALSAFFSFSKYKEQTIRFILSSLTLLLILASGGPWGVTEISSWSQTHRLKTLLQKNNLLINEQIHPSIQNVSESDLIDINSIINYQCKTNKSKRIKAWFSNIPNAYLNQHPDNCDTAEIVKDIGLNYIPIYQRKNDHDTSHYFGFTGKNEDPIEISNYDYFIHTNLRPDPEASAEIKKDYSRNVSLEKNNLTINFNPLNNHFVLHLDNDEEIVFELDDFIKQRVEGHNIILDKKTANIAVRLIITNFVGQYKQADNLSIISSLNTILLLKIIK